MVVQDDDVHPKRPGARNDVAGGDPAIGRDHEGRPALGKHLDRVKAEPIPILEPVGKMPEGVGAEGAESSEQDRGRGDPVDVVVAVNGDPASGPDGLRRAIHRFRHPGEGPRIGQVVEPGVEEPAGLPNGGDAPTPQQRRGERAYPESGGEVRRTFVGRRDDP